MADLNQTQQAFVDRYAPYANLASMQTGLPSRVILAKIALETGYGTRFANNNLPGLMSGSAAQNQGSLGSRSTATWEDRGDGSTYNTNANFLTYRTPEESIGGLVNWLGGSGKAPLNSLADRPGGGIFDRNSSAEASAVAALGRSGFSTDTKASKGINSILDKLPDLGSYGVASSFDPSLNRLAQLSPYQAGGADVSLGAGDITSNNYWSGRRFQAQGEVLPRERGANGLQLPSPEMAGSPAQLSALDKISDSLTGGLRAGANLIGNRFVEATGRLPTADEFGARVDALRSGASDLIGQLTDIATSPEAKSFSQATGLDPSQYVVNDIYRLNLGRGVDAASLPQQMEVLRTQGVQGLQNAIAGSDEGRSYTLNNFYENTFNRGIDQPGLGKYLSDLAAGKSMQAVQTEVLQSPEAQALGITPDQFASIIGAPSLTSPVGPNGYTTPVSPGSTQYPVGPSGTQSPVGPGATQYPVGPGATTSPVGPDGFEVGTVPPPFAQGTVGAPAETRPVGPDAFETSVVPAPEATRTVDNIFQTILARDPDPQGAVEFQGQIQRGVPPSVVAAQVLNSPEAKTIPPDQYQGLVKGYEAKYGLMPEEAQTLGPLASEFAQLVGRPADSQTIQHWDQQINAGLPLGIVEAQLLQAPEVQALGAPALSPLVQNFQTQYGIAPDEVAALTPLASDFAKITDRPVDNDTLRGWGAQLASGMSLPGLTAQFLMAPEVQARTGGTGDLFDSFQTQNGRSAADYLAGLSNPNGFSSLNPSANVGNGTFDGTFNAADYLAANRDLPTNIDPLTHYLTYGFNEGRAIDTRGDRINQGFDPLQYLNLNPDVKAAGVDPLSHYLRFGAAEGRALPTGSNPYSFTNFNVAQGAGATGNGSFGLNGITSSAPGGMGSAPAQSANAINPYGFSQMNVGTYAAPNTVAPSSSASWESAAPNALPGSGGAGGSAFGYTDNGGQQRVATFDPQKSENAYLAGQVAQNLAQTQAGQSPFANNPNLWNVAATNLVNSVTASNYQPGPIFSTATPATYALPPAMPPPQVSIAPVMPQGLTVNPYGGFGVISAF